MSSWYLLQSGTVWPTNTTYFFHQQLVLTVRNLSPAAADCASPLIFVIDSSTLLVTNLSWLQQTNDSKIFSSIIWQWKADKCTFLNLSTTNNWKCWSINSFLICQIFTDSVLLCVKVRAVFEQCSHTNAQCHLISYCMTFQIYQQIFWCPANKALVPCLTQLNNFIKLI